MYTDVISLDSAKDYLGVNDTSRDNEIGRIINASLRYVERFTNVILTPRDITYNYDDGCVIVYDAPINSTDSTTHGVTTRDLYSIYTDSVESITLNVGYVNVVDIPADLVETGYAIIECLFEGGKLAELPDLVNIVLNQNKRFIV